MTLLAASSTAQPRQTNWRLVLPFALVGLSAMALCVALGFGLAHFSDATLQEQRRASVLGAIDEFRTVFAEFTARRAQDIAAVAFAPAGTASADTAPARRAALESALVPEGHAHFRHDAAYVLDQAGAVVAAFPPGAASLPPALDRLLAFDGGRAAGPAPRADGVEMDFAMIGDQPAVVARAVLRDASGAAAPGDLARSVLVTVARLDPSRVSALERTSGVDSLSVETGPAGDDREIQSLVDRHGRIVGWLGWRVQYPMAAAMTRLSPFVGLSALALIGFAAIAFRRVCRSNDYLAASKAEAVRIANEDPLTGLPNRRRLLDELERALAERRDGTQVCFAYLDLDGFKDVNEALGHQAGDQLLVYVAERLHAATAGLGTVGRLGGDEFALVMRVETAAAAMQAVNAAIAAMTRPFWLAGQALQVGLSAGLAQAPRDGANRDELTRRADLALRAAKRQARGRAIAFEPAMEGELNDRRFVTRELRRTLAEGGLDVHYQPIVAADGQRVVGIEALLRWQHPERGDIPPAVFVPVAEQTGLMPALGEFVLRRALGDAQRWNGVYVAVNLSPVQVRDRTLVDLVAAVLADTGIDPARVVMEITEGVLIENPEDAQARLEALRGLGLRIALDDFGSGYSSLSYLRRFPIDKLKIDKEFVAPLGRSANGGVIVQAIMALGRALGLTVLCEGVETEEQRILLRLAGCDEMQGFLFARPGPAAAIDRLLSAGAGAGEARLRRIGRAEG